MCTIALAFHAHPRYPLVVASNRDEFFERPTLRAGFWDDAPDVLAGRDLQSGGTWLGVTRTGRFTALTNVRRGFSERPGAPSRGEITRAFLVGGASPLDFANELRERADQFNGFNVLFADASSLVLFSNATNEVQLLDRGIHALSNAAPGVEWPKIERARRLLDDRLKSDAVKPDALLEMLADRTRPPDEALPDTGVGLGWERTLSSIFIETDAYGTYASTAVIVEATGKATFVERRPDRGVRNDEQRDRLFEFNISAFERRPK